MQVALINRLLAAPNLAALVAARIYWGIAPQGTAKPYIRMQLISDPRPQHLKGYERARGSRVQVDCFGKTYGASVALAKAVIATVAEPATTADGHFGRAHAEGPRDLGEDTADGFVHRASVDLLVRHTFL